MKIFFTSITSSKPSSSRVKIKPEANAYKLSNIRRTAVENISTGKHSNIFVLDASDGSITRFIIKLCRRRRRDKIKLRTETDF